MAFIGRTPTNVPLTSSDIPDSIITDAKIVGMTSSKLSGALPAISGASLTGIASDFVKLSTVDVSSGVSSIEFINGTNGADFSTTYKTFVFHIDGLEMSDDNVRTRMQLGTGGSFRSGGSDYSEVGISATGTSSVSHPNQTTSTMRLTAGGPDSGDSGSSQNGTVFCYNFSNSTSRAMIISQACVNNTDSGGVGNNNIQVSTHCFEYTNGAVDRVKFLPDSGTITDGSVTMYGLKV
tara:strand:+ start:96 stop:803 length:708 start_codon:yes stop_codon:yes gene_type:complete